MIVAAVLFLVVAISVTVPQYQKTKLRTKEYALRNDLFVLRSVIDEFQSKKKRLPLSLNELVSEGYLQAIPADPITGTERTWRLTMGKTQPDGIWDVSSGSSLRSMEGSPYSEW
jgi:general secretion pathway protein G